MPDPNPPIADPILEQIAKKLQIKLHNLELIDGKVMEVVRPEPALPEQDKAVRGTLAQDDPIKDEESSVPDGILQWWQPFMLIIDVVLDEQSTEKMDTVLNRYRSDVEKKLREDPYIDQLAIDTKIDAPQYGSIEANSRTGTVVVRWNVWYRTLENDPYMQPGD